MTIKEIVPFDNRPVCQPITSLIEKLLDQGFIMLDNGDYKEDYPMPDPKSLFFRLQRPVELETLDLNDQAYYLVSFGGNRFMCECHFHFVKLVDVL